MSGNSIWFHSRIVWNWVELNHECERKSALLSLSVCIHLTCSPCSRSTSVAHAAALFSPTKRSLSLFLSLCLMIYETRPPRFLPMKCRRYPLIDGLMGWCGAKTSPPTPLSTVDHLLSQSSSPYKQKHAQFGQLFCANLLIEIGLKFSFQSMR